MDSTGTGSSSGGGTVLGAHDMCTENVKMRVVLFLPRFDQEHSPSGWWIHLRLVYPLTCCMYVIARSGRRTRRARKAEISRELVDLKAFRMRLVTLSRTTMRSTLQGSRQEAAHNEGSDIVHNCSFSTSCLDYVVP